MTTFAVSSIMGLMIAAQLILIVWSLRLGARWTGLGALSVRRAIGTTLLAAGAVMVGSVFLILLLFQLEDFDRKAVIVLYLAFAVAVVLVVPVFVIQKMLRTTATKALALWLLMQAPQFVMSGLSMMVVRPFLFEAFTVPTNAMAPTIIGNHLECICPECGSVSYASPRRPGQDPKDPISAICGTCWKAQEVSVCDEAGHPNDRILVVKFLRPRRWDIVVFEFPGDPSVNYVKRLVGMPGEEISIRNGDVWINGETLPRPEDISQLVYESDPIMSTDDRWGPVTLADDEFFVLGDFSKKSYDSRLWNEGAPGHAPYAVPQSHMLGVVTHIYWPPSRWRIFR
jgi:signal peptidase I